MDGGQNPLQLGSQQQPEKKSTQIHKQLTDLMDQTTTMFTKQYQIQILRRQHEREIQSIKLKQYLDESTFNFTIQQYKIKIDEAVYEKDCLLLENKRLKQEIQNLAAQLNRKNGLITKYETKIKNQENLIDEYKKSIDEQIGLQKEVIKAAFLQKQLINKLNFDRALKSIQDNYEKKLKGMKHEKIAQDYSTDLKEVKKFCSTLMKNQYFTEELDTKVKRFASKQNNNGKRSKKNFHFDMDIEARYIN